MPIRIKIEKINKLGKKYIKIIHIEALAEEELPHEYINSNT